MIPFTLGALLAATLTLPAFTRLIRQRDAAEVRNVRLAMRNTVLMEQLDKQIEDTNRERDGRLRAEANVEQLGLLVLRVEAGRPLASPFTILGGI